MPKFNRNLKGTKLNEIPKWIKSGKKTRKMSRSKINPIHFSFPFEQFFYNYSLENQVYHIYYIENKTMNYGFCGLACKILFNMKYTNGKLYKINVWIQWMNEWRHTNYHTLFAVICIFYMNKLQNRLVEEERTWNILSYNLFL